MKGGDYAMSATVVWSSSLRVTVKNFKKMNAVTSGDFSQEQPVTAVEEQAVKKQFLQKSEKNNVKSGWQ